MPPTRCVFYISDRTGITVEALGHSLLSQFKGQSFDAVTLPFIDTMEKAADAVTRINAEAVRCGNPPLVFSTLVDPRLRAVLRDSEALCFDFFDTFVPPLERALGETSSQTLGHSHGVVDADLYGVRMDAVNYALRTDDGSTPQGYSQADIIIIGASRSGKTPTCLYLAMQYGIRAANYPMTEEDLERDALPAALQPYRERLYGLIIEARRLHEIRSERRPDSQYASLRQCQYEVRRLGDIYRREQLRVLDTTHMSVEEIATSILHTAGLHRRGGK